MRIKFSSKVEYHVSDNKVVCIVKPETRVQTYLVNMTDTIMDRDKRFTLWNKITDSPSYFKGIARRKNGDAHNIEQAKAIARKKAMRAMYRYYAGLAAEIIKKRQYDTDQIAEAFGSLVHKVDDFEREIIEEIKK
jgi:hypothetical protein